MIENIREGKERKHVLGFFTLSFSVKSRSIEDPFLVQSSSLSKIDLQVSVEGPFGA